MPPDTTSNPTIKVSVKISDDTKANLAALSSGLKQVTSSVQDLGKQDIKKVSQDIQNLGDNTSTVTTTMNNSVKQTVGLFHLLSLALQGISSDTVDKVTIANEDLADATNKVTTATVELAKATIALDEARQSGSKEEVEKAQKVVDTYKKQVASLKEVANAKAVLAQSTKDATKAEGDFSLSVDKANQHLTFLERNIRYIIQGTRFLVGGFLGFEAVNYAKGLADTAARSEQLGEALHVVGQDAGYTTAQVDKVDKSIQNLGFSAEDSRINLTKYLQAHLDLNKATQLAVVAQNLSVAANESTSDSFARLTLAVDSGYTQSLRRLGLVLPETSEINRRYALSIGKTADTLSREERAQASLEAVLKAGAANQGAYAASLATVGGMLRDLPRLITNLKDSLGQGLLPAYKAIIETTREFISDLTDLSDQENGNGDAAQSLGDHVRYVAELFRSFGDFLLKHHVIVADIIEVYVAWRFVLKYAFDALTALGDALPAIGQSFGKLRLEILALNAAGTPEILLVGGLAILVGLLANAAFGTNRLSAAVDALVGGALTALVAIFETIKNAVMNVYYFFGLIGDVVTGRWDKATEQVKKMVDLFEHGYNFTKGMWEAVNKLAHFSFTGKDSPFNASQADKDTRGRVLFDKNPVTAAYTLDDAREEYAKEKAAVGIIQDKLADAKQQKNDVLISKYTQDEKSAQDVAKKGQEAFYKRLDVTHTTTKSEENQVNDIVANLKKQRVSDFLSESQDRLLQGGIVTKDGVFTKGAQEATEGLNANIEGFSHGDVSADELTNEIHGATSKINTNADVVQLKKTLAELQTVKAPASVLKEARIAIATATLQARKEAESWTTAIVAESGKIVKNSDDTIAEAVRHETALEKTQADEYETILKDKYSKGLISVQDYYEKRSELLVVAHNQELRSTQAHINELQDQYEHTQDPTAKAAVNIQIASEQNKYNELQPEYDTKQKDLEVEKNKEIYDIGLKVRGVEIDTEKIQSDHLGTLDEINFKYDELLRNTKSVNAESDAITHNIIEAQRQAEIFNAKIEEQNAAYTRQNELASALTDHRKEQIETAQKLGQLTTVQAQNATNDLIRQQQADIATQIQQAQATEQQWEDLRESLLAADPTKDVSGITDKIDELKTKSIGLQTQFESLGASVHTLGMDLRATFSEDLGNSIDAIVEHTKGAQKAVQDFMKGITHSIVSKFTQNIAETFTDNLVKNTSKKDAQGNILPNTSIFDKIFNPLNKTEIKPGDIPGKPIFAQVTNIKDIAASFGLPVSPTPTIEGGSGKIETTSRPTSGGGAAGGGAAGGGSLEDELASSDIATSLPFQTSSQLPENTAIPQTAIPGGGFLQALKDTTGDAFSSLEGTGPVGGAGIGEGIGGDIGEIIAHATTSKHGLNRPLAMLTLGSRGSSIGGALGAISGLFNQPKDGSASAPAQLADELANPESSDSYVSPELPDDLSDGLDGVPNPSTSSVADLLNNGGGYGDTVAAPASSGLPSQWAAQENARSPIGVSTDGWTGFVNSLVNKGLGYLIGKYGTSGTSGGGSTPTDDTSLGDPSGAIAAFAGFAEGGPVSGPGSGTSDDIAAMLSDGEFVVNAKSTDKYMPLLHMINNDNGPVQSIARSPKVSTPKFAAGGLVGPQPAFAGAAGGAGVMQVQLHPDAMKLTMGDWLQSELARSWAERSS